MSTRDCGKGCAGCAVAHPENPVGVQNTYFAHLKALLPCDLLLNKCQLHPKSTWGASILTCFYVEIEFQLTLPKMKHAKRHQNVAVARGTREPLVDSVWRAFQNLEGASGHVLRLSCCMAPQRLEGASGLEGASDQRVSLLLRGASRLEGASETGWRFRGWKAPQKLEGFSEDGGRFKATGRRCFFDAADDGVARGVWAASDGAVCLGRRVQVVLRTAARVADLSPALPGRSYTASRVPMYVYRVSQVLQHSFFG